MVKLQSKISVKNKKAFFEYEILDKYVCGLVLKGTEIKAMRQNKASIKEAYCYITKSELFVKNMHIGEYTHASHTSHDPLRERKLLLNRSEINKIEKKVKDKGITLIPTHLFINDKGYAKLEIAVGKGKKLYDKRESLKEKDVKRDIDRALKH